MAQPPLDPTMLKRCCSAVYEQDWTRMLLGDSFHPGGLALTQRLGEALRLGPADMVLDVASGPSTTAVHLAKTFGCRVVGVDFSWRSVHTAWDAAVKAGVADRVSFFQADAESLPFRDNTLTAVISECSFCTLPDKAEASRELFRVLAPGGRLGISDVTLEQALPDELQTIAGWVSCLAGARPLSTYESLFQRAGFETGVTESHSHALLDIIGKVKPYFLLASIATASGVNIPRLDTGDVTGLVEAAETLVREGGAGYVLFTVRKPENA